MIWEVWQYLTTPSSKLARQMGFLYESIAMSARAKRCHSAWQPHYQNCQLAIEQAVSTCRSRRKVLVFGAGTLQDIPLGLLSETFDQVLLVDLVISRNALKLLKSYPNIEYIEADVSESLHLLQAGILKVETPKAWLDDEAIDLVVSLNLITQLPLLPVRWLKRKFQISDSQADQLGQGLIKAHLDYLQRFNACVCLIADRVDREFNRQAEKTDEFDPWWGINPPQTSQTWQWEVVSLAESGTAKRCQVNEVGVSYW
ncbi:MAG: hypothetical protein IBX48_05490 [Thiomicrospira sp.]|uniref:hypothetical protein n=1 Tax=Thiomicrospira sp. TaxID=935 RepID=UPI001A02E495|nr:hypothetical protein [Thiomicrospira sp.]MBE0493777.1 hypothetical protein [Thiomicrospira sp.]